MADKTLVGEVRYKDTATAIDIVRLDSPPGRRITGLFFGRGARYLATIDDRNTVSVWMLSPTELMTEVCARLPANLPDGDEWKRYLGDQRYRKTCPSRQ